MWIADLSFAHDSLSGELLATLGAAGVIGYVSHNPAKNLTAANLADHLAHGLSVGLVFEDTVTDMTGDRYAGQVNGQAAVDQAHAIGYDAAQCVIFAADDRNTISRDWPAVLLYMESFAHIVARPGYYGDQDSIDYLAARHPEWFYWQSDSLSFGSGISRNAHLVQRYNDPRARGLSLDVNDIQREGVPFMATDGFTQADRDVLNGIASQITAPSGFLGRIGANMIKLAGQMEAAEHADVAAQLAALQQALATAQAAGGATGDPHAFADAVAAEFAQRLGANPPA